ncbi:hypothetical protein DFJ58DRAFT_666954 [Suillus subalutaceus]|uniref:uncharacterized protein n=1 Tax=Suillus subalutaceus TaxID=48586 RepID=UPI001B865660|nr:uncharacterized protein DFJ58DRAFT_666954 [Suillus subalutaceus]KAG1840717.1 hypothetical protein DFJ58DRAFT_666954 [Suillus subalutaceus]
MGAVCGVWQPVIIQTLLGSLERLQTLSEKKSGHPRGIQNEKTPSRKIELPLVLHSPAGHRVFVHAGLLSSHPKFQASDPRQPLSHWPTMDDQPDITKLRNQQELAVLTEIPENRYPWTVTNIKSVTDKGFVSPSRRKATPWSQLWNDTMSKCSGNSGTNAGEAYQPTSFPCYPFTVVYEHPSGRG